jgi:hypothetical protein
MAGSNEKRETIRLSPDDLGTPIQVELNTTYRLVLQDDEAPIAHLNLAVVNYVDKTPLEDMEYELEGCGCKRAGRTRKGGAIVHTQVPAGGYQLSIGGRKYTVVTDPERDRRHLVYVVAERTRKRDIPDEPSETQGLSDEEIAAIFDDVESEADDG